MADGLGQNSGIDISMWAASQAELARQMTDLAKQVGTVTARVDDRVTHKELMTTVADIRKEFAQKAEHMEGKFDQATDKVESLLDRAVDRIKEGLPSLANDVLSKALALRDAHETKARENVQRNEADLERKIRQANRNSVLGGVVGLIGIFAAIYQAMNGGGM